MRLPDFEKVLHQDQETPSWFGKILEQLNRLFEYAIEAFNGNISLQNLKVQVIEFQSSGLTGFPPQYPLQVVAKKKKGRVIAVWVAGLFLPNGNVWDSLNTVMWHEDGDNIVIDNVQGVAGPTLNIRLLALYE